MLTRKQAREQAFILIFEKCFREESVDEILELAVELRDFETDDYTISTFKGVYDNVEFIDSKISDNTKKWDISRISRVALAILRLALYEILFVEEIPVSVSANEAVELAKKYAAESDASFINGVIGAVSRSEV